MEDIFLYDDEYLPWKPLETLLSVYIDMIEAGKAVAMHKDLKPDQEGWRCNQENGRLEYTRPDMVRDPISGVLMIGECFTPWIFLSHTEHGVSECLRVWEALVEAIETRIPRLPLGDTSQGLFDDAALDAAGVPEGFARKLLSRARRPRFTQVAPGIKLPNRDEFIAQPFGYSVTHDLTVFKPILLFRGEHTVETGEWFGHEFGDDGKGKKTVRTGLYLADCQSDGKGPFEDASYFVLPFQMCGSARTSDGRPIRNQHDLYQFGYNSFAWPLHGVPLKAILENWCERVEQGDWQVNEHGVVGSVEVFKEADTAVHYMEYVTPFGPSKYW